jgi:hypothetical protein
MRREIPFIGDRYGSAAGHVAEVSIEPDLFFDPPLGRQSTRGGEGTSTRPVTADV